MKKESLVLLLVVMSLFSRGQQAPDLSWLEQLDKEMPEWLELYNTPGAALAIIDKGEVVLLKGYGLADLETGRKVDQHTGFNIGSISKTLTAWGLMNLVEKGRISLDDPVRDHIHSWTLFAGDFDASKVTIRQLLSHTGGISLHGFRGFSLGDSIPSTIDFLNRPGPDGNPIIRMITEAGQEWRYSGGGYLMLQLLIEEVMQMPFEDYMQEEILEPLGLENSSFKVTQDLVEASAGEYSTLGEPLDFQVFAARAAAGFQTTMADFSRFALINLGIEKNPVLSKSSIAAMMQAQVPAENYGLGYQLEVLSDSVTVLRGHAGANLGWHALYRINPDTGDGFMMFTNSGYGWNSYRRAYCSWLKAKTGQDLGAGCGTSIMATMIKPLKEEGVTAALARHDSLSRYASNLFDINAGQLVSLSRVLIRQKRWDDTLALLAYNAERFPDHANNYLVQGEVYLQQGEREEALRSFEKCLSLDSTNERARQQWRALTN